MLHVPPLLKRGENQVQYPRDVGEEAHAVVASGLINIAHAMVTADTCTTLPTQENGGNTTMSEPGLITKTFADHIVLWQNGDLGLGWVLQRFIVDSSRWDPTDHKSD